MTTHRNRALSLTIAAFVAMACHGAAETTTNSIPSDAGIPESDGSATDTVIEDMMSVQVTDDGDDQVDTRVDEADDGLDASTDVTFDIGVDQGRLSSPGCVDGGGIPEGENTFMLENRERRFVMRLPNGYDGSQPWPLVFALHGNGGSASYWDGTSGGRNIRGVLQDDAILIIAEAIEGRWRDYDADPATWPARIESELLYFDEILTMARSELCIDESAIFSMGFSGGGSFSGVLGCRRTDIRAIAVGGSVIYFDEANCVGTPAAWITIGTDELTGGREAYRDYFRDRAACDATTMPTDPDPCVAYDNCDDGTPVHYCQHPGGHIWPDFGSEAMWHFFEPFVER